MTELTLVSEITMKSWSEDGIAGVGFSATFPGRAEDLLLAFRIVLTFWGEDDLDEAA